MIRLIVTGAMLAMGVSIVAAQQDVPKQRQNLMNSISKPHYGVLSRTSRGANPYDQAAINAALLQIEDFVKQMPSVFPETAKDDVPGSKYGVSPKIWQDKADFANKISNMQKALAEQKGKIKDVDTLKASYKILNDTCESCHETYRVRKG